MTQVRLVRAQLKRIEDLPEGLLCCERTREKYIAGPKDSFLVDMDDITVGGTLCEYCRNVGKSRQKVAISGGLSVADQMYGRIVMDAIDLDEAPL